MKPLILYKPNDPNHKFHLLIDVPEEPNNGFGDHPLIWKQYEDKLQKCKKSSIGIENPEVLPNVCFNSLSDEWVIMNFKSTILKEGDTFLLPDNLVFEIKEIPWKDGFSGAVINYSKLARLRLKESKVDSVDISVTELSSVDFQIREDIRQQVKHEVISLVNNYWKFDNNQQPMSSWHDKQDLLNLIDSL